MGDDGGKTLEVIASLTIVLAIVVASANIGIVIENKRLYGTCLVEHQDKTYNQAKEICKERTKE